MTVSGLQTQATARYTKLKQHSIFNGRAAYRQDPALSGSINPDSRPGEFLYYGSNDQWYLADAINNNGNVRASDQYAPSTSDGAGATHFLVDTRNTNIGKTTKETYALPFGSYRVDLAVLLSDMAHDGEDITDVVINGKSYGSGCSPSPRPASDYDCTFRDCAGFKPVTHTLA